jgi:WD40 repeat protein
MYLASGSGDTTIRIWSVEHQKEFCILRGHSDYVLSLAFSPDCRFLASGSYEETVKLWSLELMKEVG